MTLEFIFWFSLLTVFYTYLGYPLILWVWRSFRRRGVRKGEGLPSVSILLAVYNEQRRIERKLRNLLELDYPPHLLEIIVSSDGSTDRTEERVRRWEERRRRDAIARSASGLSIERSASGLSMPALILVASPTHLGKAAALNRAAERARGEILLFTDARQRLDPQAVLKLVSNFSDPEVGAASGELILMERPTGEGAAGMGLYWRYEKWLRKMESDIDSTLGATGALYAIRKALYEPIPSGAILDDVLIPMRAVFRGYRVVFEPEAVAYDFLSKRTQDEFLRKVRTLAGNYQLLFGTGDLWSFRKNRVLFQYLSHKVARLAVPFVLVALFFSNFFLLRGIYLVFLFLQIIWYGLALWGGLSYEKTRPSVS